MGMQEIDQKIAKKIAESETILIVSHVRPDADAVGSMLGLGLALIDAHKTVQLVLQDGVSHYQYIPGYALVQQAPDGDFDMIIIVDCSDPQRVGDVLSAYPQPDLVVDHHKTNLQFAKLNVVESDQAATAAILYDHLTQWGLSFTPRIARCLLAGIIGDTIGFRTSNVSSDLLRKAADLMDLGADLSDIYRSELISKSYTAVRYWGAGLKRINRSGPIVWTSLTLSDKMESGYPESDDADLVNVLSSIKEAKIALIFVEQATDHIKVSWRARQGIDVSGIAFDFGGGGHAAAAGADITGNLEEVRTRVIKKTKDLLLDYKLEEGNH